ncbi:endonuclease V [Haloarcula onubensis]|uniref:Endonuclease V n=1 Tax=Haloarcula onubensis TaxID=2950539 RepID=A0ABU2FKN1_9EURY|nr:endonuclease V [Halomicroarcula sp. S3CR25-11]MDS0281311.1 endonuclease V [Halomicroarcula sp. S3CR25-11]
MEPVRPEFVPDPSLSTAEMEALQREIADAAVFEDDFAFDPAAVSLDGPVGQATLSARPDEEGTTSDAPLVAGVDQAFVGDRAVSAIVVLRGREVVERVYAVEPTEIPYVPGLLSFREGGAILAAFAALESEPDIVFVDGSGRIHYREAGLATHVGVTLDVPTIGVAKNLLCGRPRESLDEKLPEGARVAIEADAQVETAPAGTVVGYAVQSRQYESSSRYVNPLVVSPGHRVSAETAADLVLATAAGYKLPEPTRLADSYADSVKGDL